MERNIKKKEKQYSWKDWWHGWEAAVGTNEFQLQTCASDMSMEHLFNTR